MCIRDSYQRFSFDATCAVLSALTHKLSAQFFDINHLNIPDNVFLADPHFNVSADIDILLGAQFYLDLILANKYVRGPNSVSYTHLDVYKRQDRYISLLLR